VPWIALALTLLPLAVSAAYLTFRWGDAYHPNGDLATAELWTRDVGRHPVLVGVFSRDGWYHPGPAIYYLMAVPYRLLGSRATAMNVAALAVNAGAVTGVALYARRRGGDALMLIALLGCALLMRSFGPDELRLPWNPYLPVLPYALLIFLTWSLACGDRWALPVAVVVTSVVAQTHIGYVALAVPLVAVGAVWLVVGATRADRAERAVVGDRPSARPGTGGDADVASGAGGTGAVAAAGETGGANGHGGGPGNGAGGGGAVARRRSGGRLRSLRAPALTALVLATVLWLPPLYEQVTRSPGNLAGAWRWFRGDSRGEEGTQTLRAGWRIVSSQFGLPPEWLAGRRGLTFTFEPSAMYEPLVPVLLLVVVAAAAVLVRRRAPGGPALVAVWGLASAAGVVAIARTVGVVFAYRLGWVEVLGMVAGVIVAWSVWLVVSSRRPRLAGRLLAPLALGALAVLAVVGCVAHVRAGVPQPVQSRQVGDVIDGVIDGLPPGDGPVTVASTALSFEAAAHATAIVAELDARSIDARLEEGSEVAGEHRVYDGTGPVRARLRVAVGDDIAVVAAEPGATLLGETEGAPPPPEETTGFFVPAPPVPPLAVFLVES
jgi:hypothetical protein